MSEAQTRFPRRFRRALLGGIVAFGALGVVMAGQSWIARDGLLSGEAALRDYVDARADGDTERATKALERAASGLGRAHLNTRGPHWWVATQVPVIGDDVAAVRVIARTTDRLADSVLPEVEALVARAQEALAPSGGQFDLEMITSLAGPADDLASELRALQADVADIEPEKLTSPLREPAATLRKRMAQATDAVTKTAEVAHALPKILGSDGVRRYLIASQNNAELRATGGMPGAIALVEAENGKVTIVEQTTAGRIGRFAKPVVELTADERELWTNKPAIFPQDVGFIPDWSRAAQILAEMVSRRYDVTFDGVIGVDPTTLSRVLGATGPITVRGEQLDAGNVVGYLLNGIYLDQPNGEKQDAFYAETAATTFSALLEGQANVTELLKGLRSSAQESRLLMWLRSDDEQKLVADTAVGGLIDRSLEGPGEFGFFVNSASADKLNYYLDYEVSLTPLNCADGVQQIQMTAKFASLVPTSGLTPSIVGALYGGVNPGEMWLSVAAYGPVQGRLLSAELDSSEMASLQAKDGDRPVDLTSVSLKPGRELELRYVFETAPGQSETPTLRVTPGARGSAIGDIARTACR